jgi:hypothetical protein
MNSPHPTAPKRLLIRRNPVRPKEPPTEYCAIHGTYQQSDDVAALLFAARQPGVPTDRARAMLEESQQLRRRCPQCHAPAAIWTPPERPAPQPPPTGDAFAAMAPVYAGAGLAVFPCWPAIPGACTCPRGRACKSAGKHPLIPPAHKPGTDEAKTCKGECGRPGHGLYDATTDPELITTWSTRWPGANIGMPADANGFAILDVDPPKGGDDSERRLRDYLQRRGEPLPDTLTQITGSGGRHYLYTAPDGGITGRSKAFGSDMPGLDTRGRGTYIIVAPSGHASGDTYQWVDFFADAAPWPAVLTRLMQRPAPPTASTGPAHHPAPPAGASGRYGQAVLRGIVADLAKLRAGDGRNDKLNRAAHNLGGYVAAGVVDEKDARLALFQAARVNGYVDKRGERAVMQIIDSGLGSGKLRPRQGRSA